MLHESQRSALVPVIHDAGHGYDVFGLHADGVRLATTLFDPLYDHYFRVASSGAEHIPARGPAILAANHGGMLPFDSVMLYLDVLRHADPPRVPRPVADLFVPLLPLIGTLVARAGVVGGSRKNVERLLADGELLLVFPEGTRGIGKGWRRRYQLQTWRVGHIELALRFGAPVIPVGIVGPDDQWPDVFTVELDNPLGLPFVPLPLVPFPLPVRYHIRYGAPLLLHEGHRPEDADDPRLVAAAAARVREAVAGLIDAGLRERRGIFR